MSAPLDTFDALTDVAGLAVGHHTLADGLSGCSVVLCPEGSVAGADVRGAAPGTRETDLLRPENTVEAVHALLLSGGSAYGLDAAGGVMRWLEERGRGVAVGPAVVPIVPAAVLFDLWLRPAARPDAAAGYAACEAAVAGAFERGSVGAGAGASVGKLFGPQHAMKGGIGTASRRAGGVTVAALVAVNAVGDVVDPERGRLVAGARRDDGRGLRDTVASYLAGEHAAAPLAGATTIGIVATDALLTKAQAQRLATAGHDGLARTIRPVHTASDGDTLFGLSTGRGPAAPATLLHVLAAEAVAAAVLDAVLSATGLPGLPSAREFAP